MQINTPSIKRLNPFACPIETNARFALLVIAAIAVALMLGNHIQGLLEVEGFLTVPFDELGPSGVELDDAGLELHVQAYRALVRQSLTRLLIPTSLALGVLTLAMAIYRSHPSRIRSRKKLQKVTRDQKPTLMNNIQALSDLASISPSPIVEIEVGSRSIEGQVFGFRKRYSLRLGGWMGLLLRKAPDKFRAVVLHELAHIANQDIGRTYFAQALWIATISLLLVPLMGVQIITVILRGFQELFGEGLVGFDWTKWFTVVLPLNLLWIFRVVISLVVVAAIRSSILRVREIYADWRAALWGAEEPLSDILAQNRSGEKAGLWKRLFRLHPTPQERLAMLGDPTALFRVWLDLPVFAGVLLAFFLAGFFPIAVELFLLVSGWTTIAALVPMQSFVDAANPLESFLFFLLGTVGQVGGFIIAVVAGLIFLLVATYLMVGTVGFQVRRESIAGMLNSRRRGFMPYLRLLLPATLLAISLQVGFIIAPFGWFAPIDIYIVDGVGPLTILRDALMMFLWIVAVTCLTWLWLVYIRFFSVRLLGAHMSESAPKFARHFLTLASSILLWILYIPAVAGQLQITGLIIGDTEAYLPHTLPITSAIALVLYPVVFGVTLLLVQVRRWVVRPRCPACGRFTHQRFAVGRTCEHCGEVLAPWLFAASPPTPIRS